jgi:2-polyprenyl-6-methoxyphenol hydroxylase-like FAD-dependent oxidoreductase
MMAERLGGHAIVVGGSIAGLMTARVLSDHFDRVTIFERDQLEDAPVIHKSTPQGNHVHALLFGGELIMDSLYPGFSVELGRRGAVPVRSGCDVVWYRPEGKAYSLTGSVLEPRDLGYVGHVMSRGLLEYTLRQRTVALPNLRLERRVVSGLTSSTARVTGVKLEDGAGAPQCDADLVVDAGGRGSRGPRWLSEMGFAVPEETTIGVDFAYTSAKFKKPTSANGYEPIILVGGPPPKHVRGAGLFEIENKIWHVSLAGRFGDYPPTDQAGFIEFARELPSPVVYDAIRNTEQISDITLHRFPTSLQRHYERLVSFPERFLVIGDAVCSFNPVYGQGMTSAAMQVRVLSEVLKGRAQGGSGLDKLPEAFFPKAAEVISTPWILAANFDFAYPQTTGTRPPAMGEGIRYFAALDALQVEDPAVQRLLVEVFQLIKPLSALWDDPIRERVMARIGGLRAS